jgi:hypothetical protein
MNPHIDLHDILQRRKGEGDCQKKVYYHEDLPVTIDVKGGEKNQKHENRGRNGHRGSMSVAMNSKGGYCWKIGCH